MNQLNIQKTLDYITLQISRVEDELYECDRGMDYGRGHAKFVLQKDLHELQKEYKMYSKLLELVIKGE